MRWLPCSYLRTTLPLPVPIQSKHDRTIMKGFRRVAIVEDFYVILRQVHDKDCVHAGYKKTYARVIISYYFEGIMIE